MNKRLLALLALGISPLAYSDGSPWLTADGTTVIGTTLTTGSTDNFFIGDTSAPLGGDLEGTYLWFNASHGYDDIWAFDFRTGYANTRFETNPIEQSDIADTSFGVSYQFINEFEADNGWPTIAARAGLTIGGDYETDLIDAIGDGASGVDLSVLVGKSLNEQFAIFGDLTFRQRDNDVADGIKYLASVYYTSPVEGLGFQIAAAGIRTDSNVDIGGPGFGVEQFPQTDRDSDFLIGGVNYGFSNGIGIGFSYTSLISGRNVADTDIAAFTAGYTF